jgi:hypothetical protein
MFAGVGRSLFLLFVFVFEALIFHAQQVIKFSYQFRKNVSILFGRDTPTKRIHALSLFGGHLSPPALGINGDASLYRKWRARVCLMPDKFAHSESERLRPRFAVPECFVLQGEGRQPGSDDWFSPCLPNRA